MMAEALFATPFVLWGSPVTWAELLAVGLSVAAVTCNVREIHWGWPMAAIASLLLAALFWHNRLYGNASLHLLLATVDLWGWWQWLRGRRATGDRLRVALLPPRGRVACLLAGAALWPAIAGFLASTDTDVPWWDAFPTAWSLVAQVLLARKFLENWALWILVDVVAIGLFAYKGLWFTAGLYALYIALCIAGLREWLRRLPPRRLA